MKRMLSQTLLAVSLTAACFVSASALQGEDAGRAAKPKPVKPAGTLRPPKPAVAVAPPGESRTSPRSSRNRTSPFANLTVTSSQQGSTVLVNGSVRGTTDSGGSLYLSGLKPGAYTVVVRKEGYREAQSTISLSGGDMSTLKFDLMPIPAILSVTTNVAGAEIGLQNYGSYTDRITEMQIAPGAYQVFVSKQGYRTITREIQARPGEVLNVPVTLEPVPVEEILASADSYLMNRNYSQARAICNEVLTANPEQPRANLIMGLSYYYAEDYAASAPYLLRAVAYGEQVTLPIRHHHRVLLSDDLCTGNLTIGKGVLAFTSTDRPGHDFVVPVSSVYDLKFEPQKAGRVHMQIGIQKGGKEDKKSYNFHVIHAGTRLFDQNNPSSITVVYCNNCQQETELLFRLVQQLQQSYGKPPAPAKQRKAV